MAFNATGDCQIVLQTYKYKKQHIICRTKVLPSLVTHFGKKSNDYHWMTPASWTNIESGLWGLFEKEQDTVQSVHAELLIEHIKVRVDSTENRHSYSQKLLPGVTMSENDLYLNVQLEYVPQEATTTIGKGIDSTSKGRDVATSKARCV
ncbi:uncharacterized protein CG4951-like [Drosophila obscura]|uniref:uncharacterized protein CG4951-like n=1 Tax=Drosophila obscura TaxID=7282 RepID=UPI001BB285C4|nr:uncharacterized protein CG4951-like [Drosophila obscura]